jgi:hypothetical protein
MAPNGKKVPGSSRTFEVGLVMAGAISAGAYTAGVVDFLIEALDQWQKSREAGDPLAPPHRVVIRAMSGASAGAMTAALTAASLGGRIDPVRSIPPAYPIHNKLYDSWVNRIDISRLLKTRDLESSRETLRSLLDSTVLDDIAADAFTVNPETISREYIAEDLELYLSVTNLRGVPYNIGFRGAVDAGHELLMHSDFLHFTFDKKRALQKGAIFLDRHDYTAPCWELLSRAALASGAFPVGLAPRILGQQIDSYGKRLWKIPASDNRKSSTDRCHDLQRIAPAWPENMEDDYRFVSVDGGVLDNEPLELVRRVLAGRGERNERDGKRADRAVLLIDPFPFDHPFASEYEPDDDILRVIPALLGSMRAQARFKPDELVLAQSEDVYSRFLIAPKRRTDDGQPAEFAMASGLLGGFGGFLLRAFREHDFQLGRRNCQRFLRYHFALPSKGHKKNALFDGWTPKMKKRHAFVDGKQEYLPILPLMGSAAEDIPAQVWPEYSESDLDNLRKNIDRRINAVVKRSMDLYIGSRILNAAAKLVWCCRRKRTVNAIIDVVRKDIVKHGLGKLLSPIN